MAQEEDNPSFGYHIRLNRVNEYKSLVDELQDQLTSAVELLQATADVMERGQTRYARLQEERESERCQYETLLEWASVGHLSTDMQGRIQEANAPAGRMLGCSPGELVGQNLVIFLVEEDRRSFHENLRGRYRTAEKLKQKLRFQPPGQLSFEAAALVDVMTDRELRPVSLSWWLQPSCSS